MLRDLTPACFVLNVKLDDKQILIQGPLPLDNVGAEVVVPALTALFSDATGELCSYPSPSFGTHLRDNRCEEIVLLLTPVSLSYIILATQLKVAFVALDLGLFQ